MKPLQESYAVTILLVVTSILVGIGHRSVVRTVDDVDSGGVVVALVVGEDGVCVGTDEAVVVLLTCEVAVYSKEDSSVIRPASAVEVIVTVLVLRRA